ncbi:unnamed protein product [Microthlaspi erraticum]|uniref:F-box associated beta-propeller type 3 domain-containing protein n=1 Tax=Microthlaspi erraticum TaxID=1685480 RepID=A0A6D2KWT2_9BRAS|nr:unnamed protein product [Microthlaspi erraticum]
MTGQHAILPEVNKHRNASPSFLGFDPVGKQFKVFAEGTYPCFMETDFWKILTLGTEEPTWRSINGFPWYNNRSSEGICINGVLYYLASRSADETSTHMNTICLDVRSEKFKNIDTGRCHVGLIHGAKLINYKGRLGGVSLEYGKDDIGRRVLELTMWVLEDVEEQEGSANVFTLSDDKIVDEEVFVAGVTSRGDIVLSMKRRVACKPFYVFYFNPESSVLQSVEIQGFGELVGNIKVFVDHVEDIRTLDVIKTSARTEV